jgi:isopenicillin-N N-acyltransferase like protein
MFGGDLRVLEVYGDHADLGRGHGEACAEMIRRYTEDRIGLTGTESWSGGNVDREFILSCADDTLEHHQRFSEGLYEEMISLAGAAGITPQEAVAVGGFTDLVDVIRARVGAGEEHNCTGFVDPVGGVLAQTWDMHASAGEYVVMLKLDPLSGPAAFVQTTAGCLGQIGMNEAGIAVGINNLTAMGKPGVTWPFVVRKVLEQTDFDDAVKVVLDADLAGGHNFFLMSAGGEAATVEAMPRNKRVTRAEGGPLVHANSCLHPETLAEEARRDPKWVENSDLRLRVGTALAGDLEAFFADPAISRRADDAHDVATCGAVIIEPARRTMRAVWGVPGDHPWETFQL